MHYDQRTISEVKQRVKIVPLVEKTLALTRAGMGSWKALCPFHDERTPSFFVSESTNAYHCYGCGEHGDVIDYTMHTNFFTFKEAVAELCEQHGITPTLINNNDAETREETRSRRTLLHIAQDCATQFHNAYTKLPPTHAAKTTITSRGVEGQDDYGYGDPNVYAELVKAHGTQTLQELGMTSDNGFFLFQNRLMFTIRDHTGRPVAFSARSLTPDAERKYVNSKASPIYQKAKTLYGLDQARLVKDTNVFVCEGQMDVLSLRAVGVANAVAPCGTALTQDHVNMLLRKFTTITLFFDPDDAGIKAATRALTLNGMGLHGKMVINNRQGDSDPNSILTQEGANTLLSLVDQDHPSLADAVIAPLIPAPGDDPTGYAQQLHAAKEVVQTIADYEVRSAWLAHLNGRALSAPKKNDPRVSGSQIPVSTDFASLVVAMPEAVKNAVRANLADFESVIGTSCQMDSDILLGLLYDDDFVSHVAGYTKSPPAPPNPLWSFLDDDGVKALALNLIRGGA